jgi:hypothetical protein
MNKLLIAGLCGGLLIASVPVADAQRYPWNDRISPSITADVSLHDATGDFVYRYTLANGSTAEQRIHLLRLDMSVPASAVAAPADWSIMYQPGQTEVLWYATGEPAPGWQPLHDADGASYASEIAPGQSLSGFEVRSPCAVATIRYRTRGYNHMRLLEHDTAGSVEPDTPENAVGGTTAGPGDCDTVLEWGNRRPGTDGFMGVVNFTSGSTLPPGPVAVQIRFSRTGEQVDRSTFSASLNQQDVTAAFRSNSRDDLVAVFETGTSPLRRGRNVLLLSVEGIVPGTTRTGTDADRITFRIP